MQRRGPLRQGDRSRSLAARHRRRACGVAAPCGAAGSRGRAAKRTGRNAPRARAGGRPASWTTASERRRGEGAGWRMGVPARSRTRALQDPGHSALRRLQNVTPRNATRVTQKSSLRLGIGSYGSGGRLAAGYLVRLGAWARPGWRGRGGGGGHPAQFTAGQRAEPVRGRRGAPSGPSGPRLPPPSDPVKRHPVPCPLTAWHYRRRRATRPVS